MPEFIRNGVRLWFETRGAGRPLLFLHSLAGNATMWAEIEERVQGQVIALDARGHGRSPGQGEISVEQYGRDAAALIAELGLTDVVVIGLSMGGQAAMFVAETCPGRVSGLVLADTSLGSGSDGQERRRITEARIAEMGMAAFTKDYMTSRTVNPHSDAAQRFAAGMRAMPEQVYIEQSVSIARLDMREIAARLSQPALVVAGAQDTSTPPSAAEALAAAIPQAKLSLIEDAGHLSVLDRPGAFAGLLEDFIAATDPAGTGG